MGTLFRSAIWNAPGLNERSRPVDERVPLRRLPGVTVKALPPLLLPVILLGGIYGGVTTPTEAASVAAFYALLLAGVFYRALGLRDLIAVLAESARSTAVVALIIGGAFVINYVVATERIPAVLAGWLAGADVSPIAFLLSVNLLLLILGCLLDTMTLLLILVPLLLPTCRALGIDLVHFGVVVIVNMMIGLITPPYGVLLFVIQGLTGIPLRDTVREIWPFLAILIAALLAITLVPETVLWIPRQFGYTN